MSTSPTSGQRSPGALRATLHDRGLRLTAQRRLVLDTVAELDGGTPEQIAQQPALADVGVSLTTVYRTIELLEELGLVSHRHVGHGAPQYELTRPDPPLQLVCHRCGRVSAAPGELAEDLARRVVSAQGFAIDVAHLTISGTCLDCRQTHTR